MGSVFVMGPCFGCKSLFTYNPLRVPSIRDDNDVKQPICATCVERVNPRRIAGGLEPIIPEPDAYEPVDEDELPSG